MNKKWNEKTKLEKVVTCISGVALCVWFLFEMLERRSMVQNAKYINYTAICVICVCEAISFWREKRSISYAAIGGAILMIAVMLLEVLL